MDHDLSKPADSSNETLSGSIPVGRRVTIVTLAAGGGIIVALAIGVALWAARHRAASDAVANPPSPAPPPPDPRLTYKGPFQNILPEVAYVGDAKCATCHKDKSASYSKHPMGRSVLPVSRTLAGLRFDAAAHNPFDALGTQMYVECRGDRLIQHQIGRDEKGEAVYNSPTPVDYVLGSGTRGHSYLSNHEGFLISLPVSWFTQKHIWDLSPGFPSAWRSGRPVPPACMFCHTNHCEPVDGFVNRYKEPLFDGYAIGCERCHGPGGRHVADPGSKDQKTDADYTIVNPKHLPLDLRAAVCEQCHLVGDARVVRRGRGPYDFRPGLPLEEFWSVFVQAVDPNEPHKAVTHVEQMQLSHCYQRSLEDPSRGERKLGCVSCHDPHQYVGPEERSAYYRERCLNCHEKQKQCSVDPAERRRQSKDDSCIECHMPRYRTADIAHNASTDHRILARRDKETPAPSSGRPRREPTFVSFYQDRQDNKSKDVQRDLGIALAHQIMIQLLNQRGVNVTGSGRTAVSLLDNALANDPGDIKALEAKGQALALINRPEEALTVYEEVLRRAPRREVSLMGAAIVAQTTQRWQLAASYWRRAISENPWQADHRSNLVRLLMRLKVWPEACEQCQAWVQLDPASMEARVEFVRCLINSGDKARAREEFAKIRRLAPSNLPTLEAEFTVTLRDR
jgi:predicted CXXCH cytochrome family protein